MAEQFLYRSNIRAAFEQVRGKRMTEGMTTGRLLDSRLENGHLDGALQQGFHEVMALLASGARIAGPFRGREDVLPAPIPVGVGILAF